MKNLPSKEDLERVTSIVETGREMASSLITSAVTTAENPQQMQNQINALYVMALTILATHVMNVADGSDPNPVLERTFNDLKKEFDLMVSEGETELLECKNAVPLTVH